MPLGFRMEDPAAEILFVSLVAFVLVAWVVVDTGHRRFAPLRWEPLRALGTISYGLYLYHVPILGLFMRLTREYGFLGKAYEVKALSIVTAIILASLSWRYIEQPILSLKRKHDYSRSAGEASVPAPGEEQQRTRVDLTAGAETADRT